MKLPCKRDVIFFYREREISYDIAYMQNLKKIIQMNLFTNRNRLTDLENELMATRGKGGREE